MTTTCAPAQLPFAPRPIPGELLSSWMLRVAAANYVLVSELLDGLESRYPEASCLPSLDFSLPPLFFDSISEFCRVRVDTVQALDLSRRLPHMKSALLLRFPGTFYWCPRAKGQRLGYAFCPLCIADQRVIHVPWEWCFACITRCSIHRAPLQTGCPSCSESDPLTFGLPDCRPNIRCWSCDCDLTHLVDHKNAGADEKIIRAVEDAYRMALLGLHPHSSLVGRVTHRAFRTFVDDLLRLLVSYSDPTLMSHEIPHDGSIHPPREQLFAFIADLICHAAPSSDARCRRFRHLRSLKLWVKLLTLIPNCAGQRLEEASQFWPVPLQRRFNSALRVLKQKRWPYALPGSHVPSSI